MTVEKEKTLEEIRVEERAAMDLVEQHAEQNLAALRDEPESNLDESKDESTSDKSEDEQTDKSKAKDESTSKKTDESEVVSEKYEDEQTDGTDDSKAESKLTQAEIRAAIHLGWSEDDIKELEQANPDLAKKTCSKALESTNNLSKKFSELGKTAKPAGVVPTPESKPETKTEPKAKSIDFSALEKEYDGDPIVGVLKQVAEQNQMLANEVNTLRTNTVQVDTKASQAQAKEDAAYAVQIDAFFSRPDVAAYKEVYGEVEKGSKDWDNLTQGQIKKRWEVVEKANWILIGAKQSGEDMPLEEAFERAHLLATEKEREQTIRKQIKAKAVQRSKSLTLEPANSKKVQGNKQLSKAEVEDRAEQRLQKFRSK